MAWETGNWEDSSVAALCFLIGCGLKMFEVVLKNFSAEGNFDAKTYPTWHMFGTDWLFEALLTSLHRLAGESQHRQ
jgi:hypothetical protein